MSKFFILFLSIIAFSQATTLHAKEYVEVTKDSVNIRTSASTSGTIVGQAAIGMIFVLKGASNGWYKVALPSGEYRYLHSSLGKPAIEVPSLINSKAALIRACRDFVAAEKRATELAIAKEPDFMKQIDLERLLVDGYKLSTFKKHDIQPARTTELTIWCAKNRRLY